MFEEVGPTPPRSGAPGVPMAGLTAALDQLLAAAEAGELRRLANAELVDFIALFKRFRSRLSLVDHAVVGAVDASTVANELVVGSTAKVLASVARVSGIEAQRRVHAAEALGRRTSMSGNECPARYERMAAAAASGASPTECTRLAVSCLRRLERRFFADAAEQGFAENQLAEAAVTFSPEQLRKVVQKAEDVLFPDGCLADEQQVSDAREVTLTAKADGSYVLAGRLTGLCGAALSAVLTSLAAPVPTPEGGPEERNAGQRWHDAVHTAATMLLRAGDLPRSGGIAASIIVTVDVDDLLKGTGHGTTADGQNLTVAEIIRLFDEAELLPTLLTRGLADGGIVMSMGRSRRCATGYQTKALIARDGGCSFPHCTAPPAWSERHHIVPWREGGATDLDNLTLLCGYHHSYFEHRHWRCRLIGGLPHWIPPRWVDPTQTPRLHERIRSRLLIMDAS